MGPTQLLILVSVSISSGCGILCNIFIVTVVVRTWTGTGSHHPADFILFTLGLSNITIQLIQVSVDVSYCLYTDFATSFSTYRIYISAIMSAALLSETWLSAWLCTFYCIKLVSFRNRLILFLKVTFFKWLRWLVLLSMPFSVVLMSVLLGVYLLSVPVENPDNSSISDNQYIFISPMNFAMLIPVLLILVSLSSTLTSLVQHVLGLQKSPLNLQSSQLRCYWNSIRTMVLLLVLHTLFYFSNLTLSWRYQTGNFVWYQFCLVIYYSYCPLQTLTLIIGNRRLRRAFGVFRCYQDPSRGQKEF